MDLPVLAEEVRLDVDDLFPILDVLSVLDIAKVLEGDITLTNFQRTISVPGIVVERRG